MYWNEYDIDDAVATLTRHAPAVAPFAVYLRDWKDTVNANSDGWAHWKAGSKCADGLIRQLQRAMTSLRDGTDMPSRKEFERTLTPIKSAATRHKLTAPTLSEDAVPNASPRP